MQRSRVLKPKNQSNGNGAFDRLRFLAAFSDRGRGGERTNHRSLLAFYEDTAGANLRRFTGASAEIEIEHWFSGAAHQATHQRYKEKNQEDKE